MNKVLIDSSVWIDALNGIKNYQTRLLTQFIDEERSVVICPAIIQEILQGIKEDKDFREVKENLSSFELLILDPIEAACGAASLYRSIRKNGLTIRKPDDCLIAFYCIWHDIPLLHKDSDFDRIAAHSPLKILR